MSWISDTVTLVHDYANEDAVSAKWTTPKIVLLLEKAFAIVIPEIFRNSDGPNSIRWSFATTSGTSVYARPPHIGEIIQIAKLDSNNAIEWQIFPRSRFNPLGPGVTFDGNAIRFEPNWTGSYTLSVWYIPNGECKLIDGSVLGTHSTTTLQFAAQALGSHDKRNNAYAGYVLSLDSAGASNLVEERVISSSSFSGGTTTLTVEVAFTNAPVDADTFEIRPLTSLLVQDVVALWAARRIAGIEGQDRRRATLNAEYTEGLRTLFVNSAKLDQIVGQHFRSDTVLSDTSGYLF